MSATWATSGSVCRRTSISLFVVAALALSLPRSRLKRKTDFVSKPGLAPWDLSRARKINPEVMSKTIETVTCPPARKLRNRDWLSGCPEALPSDLSARVRSALEDRSAGHKPNKIPVISESPNA